MGDVTPLLLLLWAAVTVSSAVDLQKRIIGGAPCGPGVRQYHVKFIDEYDRLTCGGSLISNQWILTAAHCMRWAMIAEVPAQQGPNHIELISAEPKIYRDNNKKLHDIMLLQLAKPLGDQFHPVPLPEAQDCGNRPNVGVEVQIAGYAATQVLPNGERDNDRPAQLQCADIPVVDCQNFRNTALNTPQNRFFKIVHGHHHWICAQSPNNQQRRVDIAGGDSGGGVEYNGKIYGVISAMGNGHFAFIQPAIFMDVCEYMPWIEKTVGIGILNKIRNAIKKRLR